MNPFNSDKQIASPDLSPSGQIARRLIILSDAREGGRHDAARATVGACDQLYHDLSRWVGTDGCRALFTRAIAQARTDYPLLEKIHLRVRPQPHLEGVAETIEAHGAPATADAIESMLVGLIELLGRLIGDDMAMKLIDESLVQSTRDGAGSQSKRAEA